MRIRDRALVALSIVAAVAVLALAILLDVVRLRVTQAVGRWLGWL